MLEWLKELFSQNQALAAIYSGGIVAALVMHSKAIFFFLKDYILNLISFDLVNISRDVGYSNDESEDNFSVFLQNQKSFLQRNFEIKSSGKLVTGFGTQWYIIFGKIVSVRRETETTNGTMFVRTFLRVFFANKNNFINQLKNVITRSSNIYENKVKINFQWYNNKRDKRYLDSIYTNNNEQYKVLSDLKNFINNKQFYLDNNIPYKRNYLFYGKPGTGKTSLIFALASELNYDIKLIDLGSFSDLNSLLYQVYNCSSNTFLVFEDIDAMSTKFEERKKEETVKDSKKDAPVIVEPTSNAKELSLSVLLNLLDGLYTKEGMITFFTTNHIDKLDSAFLRDGRMDYKLEMTDLNNKTINSILEKKIGKKLNVKKKSINPATLQEIIIQRKLNNINENEMIKKIEECK